MIPLLRRPLSWLPALAVAAACGGGPTEPVVRTPSALVLVSGGAQTGTAGAVLATPVTFRVGDSRGPLAGVTVRFTVEQGAGQVSPGIVVTGENGLAAATWTVGTTAGGLNVLRASIDGSTLTASASATVIPAAASALAVVGSGSQFAPAGQALPTPPSVRITDPFGNPVGGQAVTFAVTQGGGTISGAQAVSDAGGVATLGQWVLGPAGGINTVRASLAGGAFADITAVGTAFALRIVSGNNQSVNSGLAVQAPLVVRVVNAAEQPMEGISVGFSVVAGGGQLTGNSSNSGPDGLVSITGWVLGTTPGVNRVRASSLGVTPVEFIATGIQAIPAQLETSPPPPPTAFTGNFIAGPFRVRVLDAQGMPVVAQPVAWTTSGGGQLFGPGVATDGQGWVELKAWRLGPAQGVQVLEAHVQGLPPAQFPVTASVPVPGEYNILVRYLGDDPLPEYKAAVDSSARVWMRAIIGNLPSVPVNVTFSPTSICGSVNETVDDIIIFVRITEIDGPFGVLGSAGPCAWRSGSNLPVLGGMRLDVADVARLHGQNQLVPVVIHEMAHILGFGTRWSALNVLIGAGTPDPHFTGPAARSVFETLRLEGLAYTGPTVPVENAGGAGSVDSHWRESVLRNELLTSLLNSGPNPLSALSLAGFRDMGYLMDDAVGEPFSLAAALFAAPARPTALQRFADIYRGPAAVLDAAGRVVGWVGLP